MGQPYESLTGNNVNSKLLTNYMDDETLNKLALAISVLFVFVFLFICA